MTEAPAPVPAKKKRGPSAKAKVLFSIGFVVVIFGALELVARIAGMGDPFAFGGSRLAYQQIYPPLFKRVKDEKGERFRPRDPRLVDRPAPIASPPTRVYVFGESAVAGLGMSENASFTRALERHLHALGGEHANDAVVNVGIVALDSRQVLKCVQDVCKNQKPDWVVLHVGNNEFLELHALKFQGQTFAIGFDEFLKNHSALYLGLKNKSIAVKNANLTRDTFQTGALQLSERTLVEKKETHVDATETGSAVASHKENLRKACQVAKAAGAKVVLMTVATNLEWEGMKDPEGGWLAKAAGVPASNGGPDRAALEAALPKLADDPAITEPLERWHRTFLRAHVKRALGDAKGALADFQAANDQDPHLRRCLAVMNDNVRALAKEEGAVLVDGARVLAAASKDGITGFDQLYDYVHFTPEGAERLGAAIAGAVVGGATGDAERLDAQVKERLAKLAARPHDAFEVDEYYGWNADRAMLSDRNLWKYNEGRAALDEKIKSATASPEELVWAANACALEVGSEARARELYAKAKQAKPELAAVIDANLRFLDGR